MEQHKKTKRKDRQIFSGQNKRTKIHDKLCVGKTSRLVDGAIELTSFS